MSISYRSVNDFAEINYNNTSLDRVIYNGVTVWEKYSEITILDFTGDTAHPTGIPTGINADAGGKSTIGIAKPYGHADHSTSQAEINLAMYELGYRLEYEGLPSGNVVEYTPSDAHFIHDIGSDNSWRSKTQIDVTKYNTCIVEEATMRGICSGLDPFYFCPAGTTSNHQYGFFTMMNDSDLYDCCENWGVKSIDDNITYYWWEKDKLFPNNHREGSGYTDDKHLPNEHFNPHTNRPDDPYVETVNEVSGGIKPGTYWSEVDWNHRLGYAFHNWLAPGPNDEEHQRPSANAYGIRGPIIYYDDWNGQVDAITKFRTSKQWMESYGYEQNVKFSVQGMTGNRIIRCLLLPFSTNGTLSHDQEISYRGGSFLGKGDGGVYIHKVTLNTNKLPADREIYTS